MDVIRLLTTAKLDYADCYLLARSHREKRPLATFDVALDKLYRAK